MAKTHILVVEDEKIVAKDIQNTLEKLGYDVPDIVSSGEEAIATAEKARPDLVLMDIRLKGNTDGVEAAGLIHDRFDIPIVYLSAHADEGTLERAKKTGPFGYILKPFEKKELQTTIEVALHKHKTEKELKQQVSTILRSIDDAVIATDKEGLVTYINPAAEALTGWGEEDILGKSPTEILSIIDQKTHSSLISKDGRDIPIDYSTAPIRDDDGKEQIKLICDGIKRMQNLVDGILQYSRLGQLREEKVEVDLDKLLARVLEVTIGPKKVRINIVDRLPVILCQETMIEQVWQNLLSNAVKYIDVPRGEVGDGATL